MPSPRYLFDHVPKTGGMSMKAVFDDLFGPEHVSPIVQWQYASRVLEQMADTTVITGHFWHAPGSLADRRRAYLTLLRRPEERTLSLYYFFRHNVEDGEQEVVRRAKALDLDAFLASEEPVILDTVQDFLVRHFRQLAPDGYSAAADATRMLASAKGVLDQYDFVGISEEFAHSVDMMCYRFGWRAVATIPQLNRTRARKRLDDLDPGVRARLRALNTLDVELYEHGLRLFADAKRAMMRRIIDLGRDSGREPGPAATLAESERLPGAPAAAPREFGDRTVEIVGVAVEGTRSGSAVVESGEETTIVVVASAHETASDVTVGIAIRDASFRTVFATNSHYLGERWDVRAGSAYETEFRMRMVLGEGTYFVTAALHPGPTHLTRCLHWREDAASFEVRGRRGRYFEGDVDLTPTLARREVAPLAAFGAELSCEALPRRAAVGAALSVPVHVRNTTELTWPAAGPRPVRASYHWLDDAGALVLRDGIRTPLLRDMRGGEAQTLALRVQAPETPGTFILRLTLVQEHVAWFEDRGMRPLDSLVHVERDARVSPCGSSG